MSKFLKVAVALALIATPVAADKLGLGRTATPEEVAAWDIDIRPDGAGLPAGSGDVLTGEEIFIEKCAVCHGDFAEGVDRWPVLAGGFDTLDTEDPVKTVGSYWPYLSTVYDYVNRAMPFGHAQSLEPDEVYAITAYILYSNDLVEEEFVLSQENFASIEMPNVDNFVPDDREQSPVFTNRDACMTDCKDAVEITMRARVLDVTPETEGEEEAQSVSTEPAFDVALAAVGEKKFKACAACHKVGDGAKNGVGPMLNGVVGAPLGAVEGFRYSKALKKRAGEGAAWDATTLDAFLAAPRKWLKGTKMSYRGLKDEGDRAAIVEFLKSHSQ